MIKITRHLLAIALVVLTCLVGGYFIFFLTAQEAQARSHLETLVSSIPNGSNPLTANSSEKLDRDSCVLLPKLTSKIPTNTLSQVNCNPEREFSDFAWKTFIALNWPANCLSGDSFGSPLKDTIGNKPSEPRVWEFYSSPANIFLKGGKEPNQTVVIPPQCGATDEPLPLQLSETAGEVEIHKTFTDGQLSVQPLIDRWGNYILSESRINPVEVKQILAHKWYSASNLSGYEDDFFAEFELSDPTTGAFALACSKDEDLLQKQDFATTTYPCREYSDKEEYDNDGVGAIEIKAAWMVLCDEPTTCYGESKDVPNYDDYYTTKRTFQVQTSPDVREKVTVPVALVGFHIAYKTSGTGWVWSTFEHKNSAPDSSDDPSIDDTTYNLFDKSNKRCEENTGCVKEPYLWRNDKFPHAFTEGDKAQISSQITRTYSISEVAKQSNKDWQEKLEGSIWQHYQLIGTQWLSSPKAVEEFYSHIQPGESTNLANVTLEPYIKWRSPERQSCIGCHELAKLPQKKAHADFSFMIDNAQHR